MRLPKRNLIDQGGSSRPRPFRSGTHAGHPCHQKWSPEMGADFEQKINNRPLRADAMPSNILLFFAERKSW